ncbi:MAG: non-heme iron oxygenase ferredoxin subunit [Rubrivivax sp.]|nr:non-heme iron oxygenase ferredoxin subunit [Rubrivivax sp.]
MTNDMGPGWSDAAAADDVWDGAGIEAQAGGRTVALFRSGEQVFATDPLCTHGNARLCDGFVEVDAGKASVECPLHQGRFDLADGRPLCEPVTEPLRTYPVRVEGGRVWVALG